MNFFVGFRIFSVWIYYICTTKNHIIMTQVISVEFIYSDLMDLSPEIGNYLVDGNEYELRYIEYPPVTKPPQTGIYRIINGELIPDAKMQITGDSYIEIGPQGETRRVDSRIGMSIARYDSAGRDYVEIIKSSIVEWKKFR